MRMCVDYCDMNAKTEKDFFHYHGLTKCGRQLFKAKYFASLDLIMGYHQVEVESEIDSRRPSYHRGLYVYNVMLFGLCNAPATFQRLMERVLSPLIDIGVLVYLDDVLI